jgi:hypothetical protein
MVKFGLLIFLDLATLANNVEYKVKKLGAISLTKFVAIFFDVSQDKWHGW